MRCQLPQHRLTWVKASDLGAFNERKSVSFWRSLETLCLWQPAVFRRNLALSEGRQEVAILKLDSQTESAINLACRGAPEEELFRLTPP
jgi:hypothetical protein